MSYRRCVSVYRYAQLLILGLRAHALACGFEAYSPGCAWSFRLYGRFAVVPLCDGTVVCAVSPTRTRHKRRRLRRGCGAYGPMRRDATARAGRCCGSWLLAAALNRSVLSSFSAPHAMLSHCCNSAAQWCLHPRPSACVLPPTRALAGAVSVHIWWSFAGLAFRYARFVSSFARAFAGLLLSQLLLRWMLFCVGCYCCVFWWELSWRRRRSCCSLICVLLQQSPSSFISFHHPCFVFALSRFECMPANQARRFCGYGTGYGCGCCLASENAGGPHPFGIQYGIVVVATKSLATRLCVATFIIPFGRYSCGKRFLLDGAATRCRHAMP